MTPLHLRQSTLDEIVFEGRNKAYGAFDLRQHYDIHLRRALMLALVLFALMAAAPLLSRLLWPAEVVKPVVWDEAEPPILVDVKPIEPIKPQEIAQPKSEVKAPPMESLPTKIKPDELVPEKPITVTPPNVAFGPTDMPGDSGVASNDGAVAKPGVGGPGGSGTETTTAPAKPEIFLSVEHMPEFSGGAEAMLKFLQKNMRYPSLALRNQIEGRVFVSFTVSATGDIVDVKVLKGLGYGTDEEAMRVVKLMPRWQPGAQNGRNVAVQYTLPITFTVR